MSRTRSIAFGLTGIAFATILAGAGATDDVRVGDAFPLRDCPVAYHEIGMMQDPVVRLYDGREIRFCCEDCIEAFQGDLKTYMAEVDKEIVASQIPFYPLTTCVIAEEKLGSMGDPVDLVWNNRLVRFCCDGCVGEFQKDPKASIAKLDEAVKAAQRPEYPLDTCVIGGEKLGSMGEPVEIVIANRLVRFCCDGCIGEFEKNPGEHLEKLDAAWKAKKPDMFPEKAEKTPAPAHGDH